MSSFRKGSPSTLTGLFGNVVFSLCCSPEMLKAGMFSKSCPKYPSYRSSALLDLFLSYRNPEWLLTRQPDLEGFLGFFCFCLVFKTDFINPWQWSKQRQVLGWEFSGPLGKMWDCCLAMHKRAVTPNPLTINCNNHNIKLPTEHKGMKSVLHLCCYPWTTGWLKQSQHAQCQASLLFQSDYQEHLRMLQPSLSYQGRHCQTSTVILQYFFQLICYYILLSLLPDNTLFVHPEFSWGE